MSTPTKILVTGCHGQLGAELVRQLGDRALGFTHGEMDIRHRSPVRSAIAEHRPNVVINTAAYTNVDQAESDLPNCRKTNHLGVGHLAEACEEQGARLIQVSTDYVFGGDKERSTPYLENDPTDPINAYGRSKQGGEQQAKRCSNHLVVRTCGLYGGSGSNFVKTVLRFAARNRRLQVVNDQHCTPSNVVQVARALVYLADHDITGTVHVTNRGATTWYDFACEILRQRNIDLGVDAIASSQYKFVAERPKYSVLDGKKYEGLGGPSMPGWVEGVEESLKLEPS